MCAEPNICAHCEHGLSALDSYTARGTSSESSRYYRPGFKFRTVVTELILRCYRDDTVQIPRNIDYGIPVRDMCIRQLARVLTVEIRAFSLVC